MQMLNHVMDLMSAARHGYYGHYETYPCITNGIYIHVY